VAAANSGRDLTLTDGERVEKLIFDWLNRAVNDASAETISPPAAIRAAPLEIKMIAAFERIEYNLTNGGWAQFLWNCSPDWRWHVETAREGYALIGANEESMALHRLRILCADHEAECAALQLRAEEEDDFRYFGEFTAKKSPDWEKLFYTFSGIVEKRLAWLAANEFRVRQALRRASA